MIIITGKVIRGDSYGKILGFPTANLDRREYVRNKMKVKFGVWAGSAGYQVSAKTYKLYKAAIVIGPRYKKNLPKIEAHLINFKGNIYGKKITISLQKFIRPFKKYKSIGQLKRQIALDVEQVKKIIL